MKCFPWNNNSAIDGFKCRISVYWFIRETPLGQGWLIFDTIDYESSIAIFLPEPVSSSLTPVRTSLMQLCASLFPCNTRISLSLRKSWLYKCPLEILRNVTQQNFGLVSIFSSEKKCIEYKSMKIASKLSYLISILYEMVTENFEYNSMAEFLWGISY